MKKNGVFFLSVLFQCVHQIKEWRIIAEEHFLFYKDLKKEKKNSYVFWDGGVALIWFFFCSYFLSLV